jgi:hypothetical protein
MPTPNVQNVVVGFANMYTAPAGTAQPADSLAAGASWLTPWVYIGATEQGVTFEVGTNLQEILIEEQSTPAITAVNQKTIKITAGLSEDTLASMKLAYGGGTIVATAAGSGTIGKSTLTLSDTLDQLAVGFEAINAQGFWRRVYIPNVLSVGTVTTAYRRAANNRAYALELHATCPPSAIKIVDQTAVAGP